MVNPLFFFDLSLMEFRDNRYIVCVVEHFSDIFSRYNRKNGGHPE